MPPTLNTPSPGSHPAFLTFAPALFVLLWATGFIGGRLATEYAEPYTFLAYRFAISAALLLVFACFMRATWPKTFKQAGHSFIAGVLIHGIYLGGVFHAIDLGMSAGLSAIIIGLQPVLTAMASAPLFGERVTARQWIGIVFGFIGLIIIVGTKPQTEISSGQSSEILQYIVCTIGLLGITAGYFYQKAFCGEQDLRSANVFQLLGATVFVTLVAVTIEDGHMDWTGELIFALGWLVLVLSLGAFSLLMMMIRKGAITKVASLQFLVPPLTAIMAFMLFGETMTQLQIGGMGLAAIGVWLASSNLTNANKT